MDLARPSRNHKASHGRTRNDTEKCKGVDNVSALFRVIPCVSVALNSSRLAKKLADSSTDEMRRFHQCPSVFIGGFFALFLIAQHEMPGRPIDARHLHHGMIEDAAVFVEHEEIAAVESHHE